MDYSDTVVIVIWGWSAAGQKQRHFFKKQLCLLFGVNIYNIFYKDNKKEKR